MNERYIIVSGEHADELRPVLKWVRKDGPRKKERILASSLLTKLEGLKPGRENWKQIIVTRKEEELLATLDRAFPQGTVIGEAGKQSDFFSKFDEANE